VLELSFEEVGASESPKEPHTGPIGEMKDRYAMGDFSGALVIAEGILESNPEDLEAPRYAQSCRDVRAGFLLSLVDGGSTVDQILDISGMTRLDALRIMYQLLDQRVISLG